MRARLMRGDSFLKTASLGLGPVICFERSAEGFVRHYSIICFPNTTLVGVAEQKPGEHEGRPFIPFMSRYFGACTQPPSKPSV